MFDAILLTIGLIFLIVSAIVCHDANGPSWTSENYVNHNGNMKSKTVMKA